VDRWQVLLNTEPLLPSSIKFGEFLFFFIQGAYKISEEFFTNIEQKYMLLIPFERGMFAVS